MQHFAPLALPTSADIADGELSLFSNLGRVNPRSTFNTYVTEPGTIFGVDHAVEADVNDDGCVDHADLCAMTRVDVWMHRAVPPEQLAVASDVNRDGWVDFSDRELLVREWSSGCAVPLPALDLSTALASCTAEFGRRWLSFEDPARPWTVGVGAVELSTPVVDSSGLEHMLQIDGCEYARIDSPRFDTSEVPDGTKIAFDVRLPDAQANPSWLGDVQVLVSIPSAGIYNAWLGLYAFTGTPTGVWQTVFFALSENVRSTLAGSHGDGQLHIAFNTGNCLAPVQIDHVRIED